MSHLIPAGARSFLLPIILLAAAVAILFLPDRSLRASTCGEHGDIICSETTTCSKFWFFYYNCSSSYEYLSRLNAEPEEPEPEEGVTTH